MDLSSFFFNKQLPSIFLLSSQSNELKNFRGTHPYLNVTLPCPNNNHSATEDMLKIMILKDCYKEKRPPLSMLLDSEVQTWCTYSGRMLYKLQTDSSTESCDIDDSLLGNLLKTLSSCESFPCESFPNFHKLLIIACTLPITSAEVECFFPC